MTVPPAEPEGTHYFHSHGNARAQSGHGLFASDSRLRSPAPLSATRVIRWGPANTELRLVYGSEVMALSEQAGDAELLVRARLALVADLIETGDRCAMDREIDAAVLSAPDPLCLVPL